MRLGAFRQPVGVLMGVRLLILAALAALVVAGCGEANGGVIKPEASTKNPLATGAAKTGG